MREEDWELCRELARFLAALDETGDTLREALRMANVRIATGNRQGEEGIGGALVARLEVPQGRMANGGGSTGAGSVSGSGSASGSSPGSPGGMGNAVRTTAGDDSDVSGELPEAGT